MEEEFIIPVPSAKIYKKIPAKDTIAIPPPIISENSHEIIPKTSLKSSEKCVQKSIQKSIQKSPEKSPEKSIQKSPEKSPQKIQQSSLIEELNNKIKKLETTIINLTKEESIKESSKESSKDESSGWDGTAYGPKGSEYFMKYFAAKIQEETQEKLQESYIKQFEKYSTLLTTSPEYIAYEEKKELEWELAEKEANNKAYKELVNIYGISEITNENVSELMNTANKEISKICSEDSKRSSRLKREKILRFLWYTPTVISKLKKDLNTYTFQNLNLMELRAIYTRVPNEFYDDSEVSGRVWLVCYKRKLKELIHKNSK
jgi:hypothetical protein